MFAEYEGTIYEVELVDGDVVRLIDANGKTCVTTSNSCIMRTGEYEKVVAAQVIYDSKTGTYFSKHFFSDEEAQKQFLSAPVDGFFYLQGKEVDSRINAAHTSRIYIRKTLVWKLKV